MRRFSAGHSALAAAMLLGSFCLPNSRQAAAQQEGTFAAAAETGNNAAWQKDLAAWRAQRERDLAAPDGWLTLAGLEWLKPGVNSFGAASRQPDPGSRPGSGPHWPVHRERQTGSTSGPVARTQSAAFLPSSASMASLPARAH